MSEKPGRLMEYEALRGLAIILLLTLHREIYDPIVFGETLKDIGFFELKDHPTEGGTRSMRLPNKWSTGTRRGWSPAPKLGQHSVEILREAGYDAAAIEAMIASGATLDGRISKS